MGGQPLDRVRSDAQISLDPDAITNNPKLGHLVMGVISQWSYVELELLYIVGTFLETDFEATYAMMTAIQSDVARLAALKKAANTCLSNEADVLLFNGVMDRLESARSCRNDYAHHIWASSPDVEDALLRIDPRLLATHHALRKVHGVQLNNWIEKVNRKIRSPSTAPSSQTGIAVIAPPTIDRSLIQVYREADLRRDLGSIETAYVLAKLLRFVLAEVEADGNARALLENQLQRQ